LVDTAFMAFDDCSPFLCRAGVNRNCVKLAVSSFLKAYRKADTVWISEPPEEATWAASDGYVQFHMLPMVHAELSGCASLEDYVSRLSRKRRQNFRHQRNVFAAAGGKVEIHRGPIGENHRLLEQLVGCLRASEAQSRLTIPYNDVLMNPKAFAAQRQTVLVALHDGQVAGFMSFLQDGTRLMQCHGGLDYKRSHEILAYHNLIYAGIEHAIQHGCHMMSMGPLNNETKRRAGSIFKPVIASVWSRNPLRGLLLRKLYVKNFEIYRGEFNVGPGDREE
jgi:predicted N-acyltransferase